MVIMMDGVQPICLPKIMYSSQTNTTKQREGYRRCMNLSNQKFNAFPPSPTQIKISRENCHSRASFWYLSHTRLPLYLFISWMFQNHGFWIQSICYIKLIILVWGKQYLSMINESFISLLYMHIAAFAVVSWIKIGRHQNHKIRSAQLISTRSKKKEIYFC